MDTLSPLPAIIRTALIVALISFAVSGAPSRADDGAVSGMGGAVGLMAGGHPTISMVSEVVKIDHLPQGHVTATFVFKNSGPASTVKIGFPGTGEGGGGTPDLIGFASWVDGKPIAVRLVAGEKSGDEEETTVWYVKTVRFAANQTHVITDTYASGNGYTAGGIDSFSYVLDTGSSWHGAIGYGKVIVDVSGISAYGFPVFSPEGRFIRKGHLAEWDFANLKPTSDDDVSIEWAPCFTDVILNGTHIGSDGLPYWNVAGDQRALFSQRRGIEAWLPADLAAAMVGGTLGKSPNGGFRITTGGRWVDFTTGSARLTPSTGRTVILPYPVDIESVPRDPVAAADVTGYGGSFHMIGVIGLIRALGGTAHFDRDGISLIATLPGYNAPKGATRAGN